MAGAPTPTGASAAQQVSADPDALAVDYEELVRERLKFLSYAPVIFISALTGERVDKLYALIDRVAAGAPPAHLHGRTESLAGERGPGPRHFAHGASREDLLRHAGIRARRRRLYCSRTSASDCISASSASSRIACARSSTLPARRFASSSASGNAATARSSERAGRERAGVAALTRPRNRHRIGNDVRSNDAGIEMSGNGHIESGVGKSFFRIGEVSRLTDTKPFVLRYWETEFPMLQPVKSPKGHRLYRREDVDTVLHIKRLLYDEGFTIAGARRHLRESETARFAEGCADCPTRRGERSVAACSAAAAGRRARPASRSDRQGAAGPAGCAARILDASRKRVIALRAASQMHGRRSPEFPAGRDVAQPGSAHAWGA